MFAINKASASAGFRHIFGDEPFPDDAVRRRFAAALADPERTALLAEEDGRAVGFVVAAPGLLEALYVLPEAWGRGVGGRLADEAEARAGADAVLWVLRDNERGRRFWERRGWRPDGGEELVLGQVELRYRR